MKTLDKTKWVKTEDMVDSPILKRFTPHLLDSSAT